ncbi:MAG: Hsp20/alpha crystallin family protein [Oligoflexia bacterium]|nr:Hsp20/alpha crystallin family protein [Oligoflexia bacterium]
MAFFNMFPDVWRGERGAGPFREMNRLQRRINRIFDEFLEEPSLSGLIRPAHALWPRSEQAEFEPACDIEETDTQFLLNFDLPGVKKEDVKIDLNNNQLTVSGERKGDVEKRGTHERYYGAFYRSFTLPTNVETDKVQASYDNGVLQIALPKAAVVPGKQIPIKEGKLIEAKPGKAA